MLGNFASYVYRVLDRTFLAPWDSPKIKTFIITLTDWLPALLHSRSNSPSWEFQFHFLLIIFKHCQVEKFRILVGKNSRLPSSPGITSCWGPLLLLDDAPGAAAFFHGLSGALAVLPSRFALRQLREITEGERRETTYVYFQQNYIQT